MNDFARINVVYGSYFHEKTAPARETVQVAGLPKGVNVEISMISVK
jgi:2-iminobutanoate/2-iminopropanoate deaminase